MRIFLLKVEDTDTNGIEKVYPTYGCWTDTYALVVIAEDETAARALCVNGKHGPYPWWNDTKYTSCVEVFPIYPTIVLEANPTG